MAGIILYAMMAVPYAPPPYKDADKTLRSAILIESGAKNEIKEYTAHFKKQTGEKVAAFAATALYLYNANKQHSANFNISNTIQGQVSQKGAEIKWTIKW